MVVIRLARTGCKHQPKFRITVADQRQWTQGRCIDVLGYYNPCPQGLDKGFKIDLAKAKEWIRKGAQPSQRVQSLIKRAESGVTAN